MGKHAKLSASSSHRWFHCPASVEAESIYPSKTSSFAEEGTLAHDVADKMLRGEKIDCENVEMIKHCQSYCDYVNEYKEKDCLFFTETKVDFSKWVDDGYGTCDCSIINFNKNTCHIIDLKYGKGVEVSSVENTQLILYALGFYDNHIDCLGGIDKFVLHIFQPRIHNYSSWEITLEELLIWGENLKLASELTRDKNAPRIAGEKQCRFCKANADCNVLTELTKKLISVNFKDLDLEENQRFVLDNESIITGHIKHVKEAVHEKLVSGNTFTGYKLVEGRSIRKYLDNAESVLIEKLQDKAWKKELIGVSTAEKLVGKEVISDITFKPKGRLTIVKSEDKRPEISNILGFEKIGD